MRISSYLTTFVLAVSLLITACSAESENIQNEQANSRTEEHSTHVGMDMETSEPSEGSIYHVSSTWQDRNGNELELENFRGKVQVLAMAYTHCEHACPQIVADMKEIREGLPGDFRAEINFVLVSIDHERDTPERLQQFAKEKNLFENQWTLLHGSKGDILELAALLGFKYQRISGTDFSHSNMITVLNKEGEIVHQRKQLSDHHSDVKKVIEKAAK